VLLSACSSLFAQYDAWRAVREAIQPVFTTQSPDHPRYERSSYALQRTSISWCGTNDRNTDKREVGGSSPPRPTIQITSKYEAILTFPFQGACHQKSVLPKICQKFG
jgi:hypothetical protein